VRHHGDARKSERIGAVGVAFCLSLALASCGGESSSAPEDALTATDGSLTVAVPDGWTEGGETSETWPTSWQDSETEEDSDYKLVLNGNYGDKGALVARGTILSGAQVGGIPGFKNKETTTEEERDGLFISKVEFEYDGENDQRFNGVLWTAEEIDSKETVALQITAKQLDADLVDDLESSISISSGETA